MKKLLSVLCVAICLLLMLPTFSTAESNKTEKDKRVYHNIFNQIYEYDNLLTMKIEAYYDDDDTLSQTIKTEYEQLMNVIPEDILQVLKKHNLTVFLVYNCKDYWPTGNPPVFLRGFYTGKAIFVSLCDEDCCINNLDSVLYHEIGHAVDDYYGNLCYTKDFKTAYNNDIEQSHHCPAKNMCEAFAEVFCDYMFSLYEFNGKKNYLAMASVLKDYPSSSEYLKTYLNLESIDEGYAFPLVKVSRWRIAQQYYNSQKIEKLSEKVVNILSSEFIANLETNNGY